MYNNFDKGGLEMSKIKNNALGVILCLAIAMPAYYLGKQLPLICHFNGNDHYILS